MPDQGNDRTESVHEELYYEEPPRSGIADSIGVLLALLALTVIGYGGYLWLTPGMELTDFFRFSRPAGVSTDGDMDGMQAGAGTEDAEAEPRCPTCNMFALRSYGAVEARWSDGSVTQHDSWVCVADWQEMQDLQLVSARVRDIASGETELTWVDANEAFYRYEADSVPMSMPPHVAAYPNYLLADADSERGGEVMGYEQLLERFGINAGESAGDSGSDMTDERQMEMDEHAGHGQAEGASSAQADMARDHDSGHTSSLYDAASFPDGSCSYCGMFADRSLTHVVVRWSDGGLTQHDSFDCVFGTIADEGRSIDAIEVTAYGPDEKAGSWIDARSATYLYDTGAIKGSMPPYVAAFPDVASAQIAQTELGGEIVDFNGLAAKWQQ